MGKRFTRLCAGLGTAFAMAGCSTLPPTEVTTNDCMVSTRTSSQLLLIFVAEASTGERYSTTCRDGKAAAMTTFIGRNANGDLHPIGAAFAVTFHNDLLDKIQSGSDEEKARAEDIERHFKSYLKKFGGKTIDDIKKYMDELGAKATAQTDIKTDGQEPDKAPKPAPVPVCTGTGVFKSCTPSRQP